MRRTNHGTRLGHVPKMEAETLDDIECGRITLPDDAKALLTRCVTCWRRSRLLDSSPKWSRVRCKVLDRYISVRAT
jgi:hypothetical protein